MSLSVDDLKRALEAAKARVALTAVALAPKHRGGEMDEFRAALDDQLRLEREVALAKGEETALLIDWRPKWDVGAPLPYVAASGHQTFLIYNTSEPDPAWDGGYAIVVDPTSDPHEPLAIVELKGCYAHKFGGHNDEVIERLRPGALRRPPSGQLPLASRRTSHQQHPPWLPPRNLDQAEALSARVSRRKLRMLGRGL